MQENKDYEQMYYDLLFENKKLKDQIKVLIEELEIYSIFSNKKSNNKQIAIALIEYFKKKRG